MANFNGKAIYNPSGKAGEYAGWACNFYVGCSNGCEYCYCKRGILAPVMGGDTPTLKKCFRDEEHALEVFKKELTRNLDALRKHGLFFSFSTDPCLPETIDLTIMAVELCMYHEIPVKILTKVDFVNNDWEKVGVNQFAFPLLIKKEYRHKIAFGFTLTGHDELEPGASTNAERIEAMRILHDAGFKTFASIEPIIDFVSAMRMILMSSDCCDLFKIGLKSGGKYDIDRLQVFPYRVCAQVGSNAKIYFKDSLLKYASIERSTLPDNCVGTDYNLFNYE